MTNLATLRTNASDWETIKTAPGGKSAGVAVGWRKPGNTARMGLAISLGGEVVKRLALKRGDRVVVKRNRIAGRLRISVARNEPRDETRAPAWKDAGVTIYVPLPDLQLTETKRAQEVKWDWPVTDRESVPVLEIWLPVWACQIVKIT